MLRQTAASAYSLATSAAASEIQRLIGAGSGGGGGDSEAGLLGLEAAGTVAAARLNTAAERGVEAESAAEVLGEGGWEGWRSVGR